MERKLRDHINELSQFLTRTKLDKFKRDEQDYTEGMVYTWQRRSRLPARRARSISFNLPSSATTSDDDEIPTYGRGSFLEPRAALKEQKGRREGADRGGKRTMDYQLRPRLQRRTQTKKR